MPRILTPSDVTEFRNRLCEVASELFAEVGQTGFNMRELAKRLGVSAMTPYRYFQDKDAILCEVRARAFARFADWLEEQRACSQEDDVFTRAYAHFAIQHQTQYRLMFDLTQPHDVVLPALPEQEGRARAAMVGYVRDLVDRKILVGDPELLGLVLWSTLHGVATLYLTGKISSREFDVVLSQTVGVFADCHDCAGASLQTQQGAAPNGHRCEDTFSPGLRSESSSVAMAG